MASRTAKSLAGIRCFLRPREWISLGTEQLLLLRISSQWMRRTAEPTWSSAAFAYLQTEKIFCWHIYGCFCWLFDSFLPRNRSTKPTLNAIRGTRKKQFPCRAQTRPKFSHISLLVQTLNLLVQALKLYMKTKLSNETNLSPTFLSNSYFLSSNFAVRDLILFSLNFII